VFQRPITGLEVSAIRYFKRLGKRVVVDYDDNLFAVPPWNQTYELYADPETRKCICESLTLADAVTTTTAPLADVLSRYNKKTAIIPNALDDYLLPPRPQKPRRKIVSWRGAHGHDMDLWEHKDAIVETMRAHRDWKLYMFGHPPYFMQRLLPEQFVHVRAMEYMDYMDALYDAAAAVHIVPLEDNEFNRCKSNISEMEASWAGSSVCYPGAPGRPFAPDILDAPVACPGEYPKLSQINHERVELIRGIVNG
jgi:hypothetical protein